MLVAQSAVDVADPPFGAIVARQLSVWPFAARTQRLFLIVDPSVNDPSLRRGLLRAMQQAYFRSDSTSQTRSVREAALAAHYVLRHHNRDVLPLDQIRAAAAVAAIRGPLAYVALAGDATALAWRDGVLTGQRGRIRLQRPLGLEQDPRVTLWSTQLYPGDRLVLLCGASWSPDSRRVIEEILGSTPAFELAEERLAEALGATRPAGVLIVDPARSARPERHLVLVSSTDRPVERSPSRLVGASRAPAAGAGTTAPKHAHWWRSQWLSLLLALALLGAAAGIAVRGIQPVSRAAADSGEQASQVAGTSAEVEGVVAVNPAMAVRLGPSGGNVVDLAIGDDALYTLDVVESTVRVFGLDAQDQQPTPETLLLRAGSSIGGTPRHLAMPVAIEYVAGSRPNQGALLVLDQARAVVQVAQNRSTTLRPLQGSGFWRELGALGSDGDGRLYVLDSGARRLLAYAHLVDPPQVVLEQFQATDLAFDRVVEIVGGADQLFLRLDDGTVHRAELEVGESVLAVRPADGRRPVIAGIDTDRVGGLYLADPGNARILQITADGAVVRQLCDSALAGLRQIHTSRDGRRLYGLVASGVLVFDLPDPA